MLTEELWAQMKNPGAWNELVEAYNKQDQIIAFRNGSSIYLRSCDRPDDLRGPNLAWFYIDEASKVPQRVWRIMEGRIRKPPERGWITTTPRGRNWIWEEFARRERKSHSFVVGSTGENVHLSQEYIESLLDSYSGAFLQQEFYGQFVGWEGLVYNVDFDKHHLEAPTPGSDSYKYAIAGIDWGWIDPTVIVVGLVGFDNSVHLVDEFYQNKTPIETIVEKAREFNKIWGIRTFWCDPSRPEYIQEIRQGGLDSRKGHRELDPGIAVVNKYLTEGRLKIDFNRCPRTIDEFDTYHYEEDDMGQILKNRPVDANNHAMDALRYMMYSHSKVGYVGSRGVHR